MKLPASLAFSAFFAASVFLGGCSSSPSSPMSRIDANRAEYETWPIEVKQAVLDGRVEKGMTQRQVEVAIGKPANVEIRETRSGTQEVWTYKAGGGGGNPLKGSTVSVGTYGIGVSTAPIGTGGGYEDTYTVIFEDGVVVSSEAPAVR